MKKFWQKNHKIIKRILAWFLTWRISLLLVAWLGAKVVSLRTGFLGESVWANFDGVHYLNIARQGYLQFQQAFFPLYPFAIRRLADCLALGSGSFLVAGLGISHLAFLVALFLFHQLARLDFEEKVAWRGIFYLLIFPTSFFFGGVYTESLFLAFALGAFLAARKNHWWLAGILGGLASATRLVGIFLFPALLAECHQQASKKRGKQLNQLVALTLIAVGFLVYMGYLKKTTGDPFFFVHIQPLFGAERTGGKLILLHQVFWRYLKMILGTKLDYLYFTVWLELLSSVLFLGLAVLVYLKSRLSYTIFMALSFLTPTLTGTFSSMPRYVLVLFPSFMVLAQMAEKDRRLRVIYPIAAIAFGLMAVSLFVRGWFIG